MPTTKIQSFQHSVQEQEANALAFGELIKLKAKSESIKLEAQISSIIQAPEPTLDELWPNIDALPELAETHHISTNLAHGKPPISDILKERPYPPIQAWERLATGNHEEAVNTGVEYLKRWPGAITQPLLEQAELAKTSPEQAANFLHRYISAQPEISKIDPQKPIAPQIVASGEYLDQKVIIFENPESKFRQGFFEDQGSWIPFDGICTDIDTDTIQLVENFDLGKHTQTPELWINTSKFITKIQDSLTFGKFDSQKQINEILSEHSHQHPAAINQNDAEAFRDLYQETHPEVTKQIVERNTKEMGNPSHSFLWTAGKIIKSCFTLGKLGIETPIVNNPPVLNRTRSTILTAITELNVKNLQNAFRKLQPIEQKQAIKHTEHAL